MHGNRNVKQSKKSKCDENLKVTQLVARCPRLYEACKFVTTFK